MRAMFTIAASLTICSCLFGCDQNQKAPAPVAAAAAPSCNCQQQTQPAPAPPVEQPRPGRHHHYRRHDDMADEASWQGSTTSVSSYSESRESEYAGEGHKSVDAQGPAAYPPPPPSSTGPDVWVDGYGRSHYASGAVTTDTDGSAAVLSAGDTRRRSDPWRGYNSKCRNAVD
jgi:hypothetical protein